MGCPSNGYVFEMRKATRKSYHKQIKYINKRENNIKNRNLLICLLTLINVIFGRKYQKLEVAIKKVASTVEGLTKHDILFNLVKSQCMFSVNVVNYVHLIQYILNTTAQIL